jgi:hypothetical protein
MAPEPLVKIGARSAQRSQTAGLIFAECDRYPLTDPGVLYDTDDLVVFWSWFAKTPPATTGSHRPRPVLRDA